MTPPPIHALRPFLPAADLAASLAFYRALGFTVEREFRDGSGAIIELGACSLILARHDPGDHGWMMQLVVPDLDAWWAHIQAAKLDDAFGVPPPKPPAMQPWGLRVAYVVDPSGVLWHVVPVH